MKTKKRSLKDDQILASILGGAEMTKRPLRPGGLYLGTRDGSPTEGPCCAIGAGVLYLAMDLDKVQSDGVVDTFCKYYKVSEEYAVGVSDGFETGVWGEIPILSLANHEIDSGEDYERGFAVGAAVRGSLDEVATLEETR